MTPLHTLSAAAAQIARGEKARFPITADDEIQTLANTLNNMQDSLASTIHEAQERKEELAQIVGALPVGVILIDDDKRIRYINREAARICRGNGGGELPARGSSVEVIIPSGELYQMLDEPDGKRTISVMRSGRVEVEATTLVLPRGRMIVLQDLTDKLRLEEARRDFFIDAGHEFQTPLTIMRTGLELMKSAPQMKEPERAEGRRDDQQPAAPAGTHEPPCGRYAAARPPRRGRSARAADARRSEPQGADLRRARRNRGSAA